MKSESIKKPQVFISEVQFSGGQRIALGETDIVAVVGANNAGKSKSLKELYTCLAQIDSSRGELARNQIIKHCKLTKTGNAKSLRSFLDQSASFKDGRYIYENVSIFPTHADQFDFEYLGDSADLFRAFLDAHSRIGLSATAKGENDIIQRNLPQHFLYDDELLLNKVSRLFHEAFGSDLFFDFRANPEIPIHVGTKPKSTPEADRVSNPYTELVRLNPRIDEQGDGMRSYAGILFHIVAFRRSMTFIDEPEAFLHPPQMRRLGKTLVEEADGQLFVATHSTDILRGLLEASSSRVRVIRLQRNGAVNDATELAPTQIEKLWSHPHIKYSTALDAIFHEQALICEDDSDCRLYSAVADHLSKTDQTIRLKDTHYVPTGGKAAVPRIASALTSLGVPTKTIYDIDLLADEEDLKRSVDALGGNWELIKPDWKIVSAHVQNGVAVKDADTIRAELVELLLSETGKLPKSQINDLLKQDKPWSIIKKTGKAGIPPGDASAAFDRLSHNLKKIGLHLVEVGQAEGFCRSIGKHGPEFVTKLLEQLDLSDAKLAELRDFVRQVIAS